ncbi:hypothetical protein GCM10010320_56900 [Streptomyces caelestis]|nr:hypothetical protein GCM10010320_56900 [Streptomyces caelestis]
MGLAFVDDVAFIRPEHGDAIASGVERRGIRKRYYLEIRSDVLLRHRRARPCPPDSPPPRRQGRRQPDRGSVLGRGTLPGGTGVRTGGAADRALHGDDPVPRYGDGSTRPTTRAGSWPTTAGRCGRSFREAGGALRETRPALHMAARGAAAQQLGQATRAADAIATRPE